MIGVMEDIQEKDAGPGDFIPIRVYGNGEGAHCKLVISAGAWWFRRGEKQRTMHPRATKRIKTRPFGN